MLKQGGAVAVVERSTAARSEVDRGRGHLRVGRVALRAPKRGDEVGSLSLCANLP